MKQPWMIMAVTGLVALSALALLGFGGRLPQESSPQEGQPPSADSALSTVQPIAFPHNTHAGQFNIDCQYCHFAAERSWDAGIPTEAACMGCHTVIAGRNRPQEVQKLRDYWQKGEQIPWVRIYKLPDHVHFPHMRHVAKDAGNLDCAECHGDVKTIDVMEKPAQSLKMGWCVSCHREKEASTDCSVCHY